NARSQDSCFAEPWEDCVSHGSKLVAPRLSMLHAQAAKRVSPLPVFRKMEKGPGSSPRPSRLSDYRRPSAFSPPALPHHLVSRDHRQPQLARDLPHALPLG